MRELSFATFDILDDNTIQVFYREYHQMAKVNIQARKQ